MVELVRIKHGWRAFCLVAMVAASVAIIGCSGGATQTDKMVSITLDNEALSNGQVVLDATISNITSEELVFLPWQTPFEPNMTGPFLQVESIEEGSSADVFYQGMMVKRLAPQANDFITLAVGQSYDNSVNITKSYSFCAGKRYRLVYHGPLYTVGFEEIPLPEITLEFDAGRAFPECETP